MVFNLPLKIQAAKAAYVEAVQQNRMKAGER
jgi:hypothetical protein